MIKTEKGSRKVEQDRYNASIMLLGLVALLIACTLENSINQIAVGLLGVFCAGILGKAVSFNWANTKEYDNAKGAGNERQ